jgi:hypothetical protein
MTQQIISGKNIIILRGIKIDLSKLSKIQSPVLKESIKRLFYHKVDRDIRWKETRHSEYKDHSDYTEHYEDWKEYNEYKDYRKYGDYNEWGR